MPRGWNEERTSRGRGRGRGRGWRTNNAADTKSQQHQAPQDYASILAEILRKKTSAERRVQEAEAAATSAGQPGWQERHRRATTQGIAHITACEELLRRILELPEAQADNRRADALFDLGEALTMHADVDQLAGMLEAGSPVSDPPATWQQARTVQWRVHCTVLQYCDRAVEAFVGAATCSSRELASLQQQGLLGRHTPGATNPVNSPLQISELANASSGSALVMAAEATSELADLVRGMDAALSGQVPAVAGMRSPHEMLMQARARYTQALELSPDDSGTLLSFADCCVRCAQSLAGAIQQGDNGAAPSAVAGADSTTWQQVDGLFQEAVSAYQRSLDAQRGNTDTPPDEISSLLHAWAMCLLAKAQVWPDAAQAKLLFAEASQKLQEASSVHPLDVQCRLALGEVLASEAERLGQWGAPVEDRMNLLGRSVEEGFGGALRIDSRNVEAHLGQAEGFLSVSRILVSKDDAATMSSSEEEMRRQASQSSISSFARAIELMKSGRWMAEKLEYGDQCAAVFNMACACSLAREPTKAAECLERLRAVGWLKRSDTMDNDLRHLTGEKWWEELEQLLPE